ncbi:hypothetical protein [uncultured Ruegeria sp.]|uniref:hypothetical protein n=1 Tax=uncultured Ruegeria sp. TaxID=259304 RepID=UPI0026089E90|nr:hypothetical protein [uncultured Ruegeria sp.]
MNQASTLPSETTKLTASDKCTNQIKYVLLCRSHPHRTFAAVAVLGLTEGSFAQKVGFATLS